MQNFKEVPFKYRFGIKGTLEVLRFLWQYRTHPETLDPFLTLFKERGVPEQNLTNVRNLMIVWRQEYSNRGEASYPVDSYLTAGMGAIDLVLLTIVLPLGVPDRPLFIALLSLAVSLVLVGTALFVSFVKRDLRIKSYGNIHSTIVFVALVSGTTALTATLWHVSSLIGIVFLVLVVLAYLTCAAYYMLMRILVGFLQILQAASTEEPGETAPAEMAAMQDPSA